MVSPEAFDPIDVFSRQGMGGTVCSDPSFISVERRYAARGQAVQSSMSLHVGDGSMMARDSKRKCSCHSSCNGMPVRRGEPSSSSSMSVKLSSRSLRGGASGGALRSRESPALWTPMDTGITIAVGFPACGCGKRSPATARSALPPAPAAARGAGLCGVVLGGLSVEYPGGNSSSRSLCLKR